MSKCTAKLDQYVKFANFAPQILTNFNKYGKRSLPAPRLLPDGRIAER